jgi:hypothetical protein
MNISLDSKEVFHRQLKDARIEGTRDLAEVQ